MRTNPHIQNTNNNTVRYHKAYTYHHTLSLLEKANKCLFTDNIRLFNSSKNVAQKVMLMMYLAINPNKDDVEILECNYTYNIHVYPNGIIQINFEDVDLHPQKSIDFILRIKTGQTNIAKEHLIKNNYLFFCF